MPSNADDEQAEVRLTETDVQEILNPGEVPGLPPLEATNMDEDGDEDDEDGDDNPLAEAAGTMARLAADGTADDRKPPALPAAAAPAREREGQGVLAPCRRVAECSAAAAAVDVACGRCGWAAAPPLGGGGVSACFRAQTGGLFPGKRVPRCPCVPS